MDPDFQKFSKEEQYRLIKAQVDLMVDSARKRDGIIPQVSALSATLLIIATFNQEIVPFNCLTKTLLTLLLLLIPTSLIIYEQAHVIGIKRGGEIIKNYTGKNPLENLEDGLFIRALRFFPNIGIGVITFVILGLVYLIWN